MQDNLELPREKPRTLLLSLLTRLTPLLVRVVGRKRVLKWMLDASWATRRIAHEQSGRVFGDTFHNQALGLTEEVLADVVRDKSVVDLGCGQGRWSRIASRYAKRVVGIDQDEASIAIANKSTPANAKFTVGDARSVSDRFDVALAIHLIEHIEDPVGFLRGVHAIADSLVIEVPDFRADALNLPRLWLDRPFYTDADHLREYTKELLAIHLREAGWAVPDIDHRGGALVAIAHHAPR